MKITFAPLISAQTSMILRLFLWQCVLGIWFVGESGFGFLAPALSKMPTAWKEEGGLAAKLTLEDSDVAKSLDLKHVSGKNASQNSSQKMASQMQPHLMREEEKHADAHEPPVVVMMDVPIPQVIEEEGWTYKKRTVKHRSKSSEGKLINFMRKYAVDKHEIDCVILCRYGERQRHSWKHCLTQCVSKSDKRQSFMKMLPEEDHNAKALDYDVPPEFEEELKRIRSEKTLDRHGEL
jgi:hypothetical protein